MAQTLLTGVNEVLKKAQILSSTNELSSLTNSGKQVFIDQAVQLWNEAVDQLYSTARKLKPYQAWEDTITLVTGTRSYSLPADLVQIRWPLHDETNGQYISEFMGGYEALRNSQSFTDNYNGLPLKAAISPIDGTLYLDYIPTSGENGNVYKFFYWKELELSLATDEFPFENAVFRAMVSVVTELWKGEQENKINEAWAKVSFGRAARILNKQPNRASWVSRPAKGNTSPIGYDPFEG